MEHASALELAKLHHLFRETGTDYRVAYKAFNVRGVVTKQQYLDMMRVAEQKLALLSPPPKP